MHMINVVCLVLVYTLSSFLMRMQHLIKYLCGDLQQQCWLWMMINFRKKFLLCNLVICLPYKMCHGCRLSNWRRHKLSDQWCCFTNRDIIIRSWVDWTTWFAGHNIWVTFLKMLISFFWDILLIFMVVESVTDKLL